MKPQTKFWLWLAATMAIATLWALLAGCSFHWDTAHPKSHGWGYENDQYGRGWTNATHRVPQSDYKDTYNLP
jgi:hypothetical protein